MSILNKILGGSNESQVKALAKLAEAVEAREAEMKALSDEGLRAKTAEFRLRYERGETLDELLPETFAAVREASVRTTGLRHFKVQLMGGMVLHQGRIAEMKTGEGKTLVATLAAYLNALPGKGVHIVTVNDYLAKRDSEWMGKIYRFLGMSVGVILNPMENDERRIAYNSDITYGTNSEYGFDYLRDNMSIYSSQLTQRDLNFAIVDEVDSILIDEARTPLIISGAGDKSTEMYTRADRFVSRLKEEGDYTKDEKMHAVNLTEEGVHKAEQAFGVDNLSDVESTELNHHIQQALKAHALMHRDKDYVVTDDGQVIIVDEFTGRMMVGRRFSDGLHQAIEAKENVRVERESKTMATITLQNYFRMYQKLSGMTGTAKTEEEEFKGIYKLDVVCIPTHMPMIREDSNDSVYVTRDGKFRAVVEEIAERHATGQPVLVGTISVEKSEILSGMLRRRGIRHEVLNAKYHAKEAEIVAQAGKLEQVTIATNMAGRGTDIILGGNPEYMVKREMRQMGYEDHIIGEANSFAETHDEETLKARAKFQELVRKHTAVTDEEHKKVVGLGGLHIIGTERHESRRIDNQLRGRCGRQGDPGSSRFYISLDDDLMRLFGSDRIKGMVSFLSPEDTVPMAYNILSRQIESAQKRVEGHNFGIRKHVLQYDDVMNKQREIIYSQRRKVLMGEDVHDSITGMVDPVIDEAVDAYCPGNLYAEEWDIDGLAEHLNKTFLPRGEKIVGDKERATITRQKLAERLKERAKELYMAQEETIKADGGDMRAIERFVLLKTVDNKWTDHIDAMDQLRQGIGLRAYGNIDPVVEYKMEGFDMFDSMIKSIQEEALFILYHVTIKRMPERREVAKVHALSAEDQQQETERKKPMASQGGKVGRNDPCPCGSSRKYKECCGRN
ncbi:MAG: preprotein translocase subunit SecA [Bacillota bacterium]|nr:preprotein translocase subunit SecA [Bacillota bacterium]